MAGEKLRVFCVDDDPDTSTFYRLALELEPDMELVGSHESTVGLNEAVADARVSILLLDLLIPGCDSLQALADLRARFPDLPVLVVSGLDEPTVVAEAFRRGANGFFLKTMDLGNLVDAIRRTAAGERVHGRSRPTWTPGAKTLAREASES